MGNEIIIITDGDRKEEIYKYISYENLIYEFVKKYPNFYMYKNKEFKFIKCFSYQQDRKIICYKEGKIYKVYCNPIDVIAEFGISKNYLYNMIYYKSLYKKKYKFIWEDKI